MIGWGWLEPARTGLTLLAMAASAQALDVEWVTVGDPGNPPDKTGHGAVAYEFQITKHEITVAQYAEFLKAVATKGDPRALWNAGQKIVRTGNPGAFHYAPAATREREPVMQVNFLDAMRFANWLHHGGGSGDTETGAYLISRNGGLAGREAGARIWIPNENEWYKAAYHQPQAVGGPAGSYWRYPTRSDAQPKLAKPGDPGPNLANFLADITPQVNGGILRGFNDVMPVGSFSGSASHYGTLDQAGNAWEWIETTVFETQRVIRGGSMCGSHEKLLSKVHTSTNPAKRYPDTGFRLARSMPKAEPRTATQP
jgi:sulfatase modifying factor 1